VYDEPNECVIKGNYNAKEKVGK